MDGLKITSSQNGFGGGINGTGSKSVDGPSRLDINSANPDAGISENQGPSFAQTLNDAVNKVNDMQKSANTMAEKVATGQSSNIADVMIAAEKADIALKLMVQVRNKIIEAYQEVMKMQV